MSFLESIQLKNGQIQNLAYHQSRLDLTMAANEGFPRKWHLKEILDQYPLPENGHYKIRVVYTIKSLEVAWQAYQIRPIQSLTVVQTDQIDYSFKTTDRAALQALFAQRAAADDIIISKNNWITDSYYANLAFYKEGNWYTPDRPLLKGTKRQQLLDQGTLRAIPIKIEDLPSFEKVALINAMIDLKDEVWVDLGNIYL